MFRNVVRGFKTIVEYNLPRTSNLLQLQKSTVTPTATSAAAGGYRFMSLYKPTNFIISNSFKCGIGKQQCLSQSIPLLSATTLTRNSIGDLQQRRTIIKFSLQKGKRKSCKAVLKRFKRLDWGGWIRTRCGRHKKMWKKSGARKRRLREHVLTNSTQSWLLDKMVTKFWRRPKYYVDDPYRPYHNREEYFTTRKTPIKY